MLTDAATATPTHPLLEAPNTRNTPSPQPQPTQQDNMEALMLRMAQMQMQTCQQLQQAETRRQEATDAREAKRTEEKTRKDAEREEQEKALAAQVEQKEKALAAQVEQKEKALAAQLEQREKREERILSMINNNTELLAKTLESCEASRTERGKHTDPPRMEHYPTTAKLQNPENLEAFLTTFQETMTMHKVPEHHWVMQLIKVFDDTSAQFVQQLDGPQKYNLNTVQELLTKFHCVNPSLYRKRWNALSFLPHETGQQHAQRACILWNAWSKPALTRKDMADMVIREKFISNLPPITQEWVEQQNPQTLAEAADFADDHLGSRKATTVDTYVHRPSQYQRRDGPRPRPTHPTYNQ